MYRDPSEAAVSLRDRTVLTPGNSWERVSRMTLHPTPLDPITRSVLRSVPRKVPAFISGPPPPKLRGGTGRHPKFNSAFSQRRTTIYTCVAVSGRGVPVFLLVLKTTLVYKQSETDSIV